MFGLILFIVLFVVVVLAACVAGIIYSEKEDERYDREMFVVETRRVGLRD